MFIRRHDLRCVVDMDLSKCFDRLDHDLILASIRRRVRDGSILKLIRMFLESGVMIAGNREATEVGSPPGGVVRPLIANIYLDAFDQEMKRRGHRIVRYADDILIFCRSPSAAHRARKVAAFKDKIKRITRRNSPVHLEKVIGDLNPALRGFANYFRMAHCKGLLGKMMGWIRRRLRAKQLALWKRPKRLHRRPRQLGYQGDFDKIRMRSRRNSRCELAHQAMPNAWFQELGLFDRATVETGVLPLCT
jgi:RNA-directed DNA polymerase